MEHVEYSYGPGAPSQNAEFGTTGPLTSGLWKFNIMLSADTLCEVSVAKYPAAGSAYPDVRFRVAANGAVNLPMDLVLSHGDSVRFVMRTASYAGNLCGAITGVKVR